MTPSSANTIKFVKGNIYLIVLFSVIFNSIFTSNRFITNKDRIDSNSEILFNLRASDSIKSSDNRIKIEGNSKILNQLKYSDSIKSIEITKLKKEINSLKKLIKK